MALAPSSPRKAESMTASPVKSAPVERDVEMEEAEAAEPEPEVEAIRSVPMSPAKPAEEAQLEYVDAPAVPELRVEVVPVDEVEEAKATSDEEIASADELRSIVEDIAPVVLSPDKPKTAPKRGKMDAAAEATEAEPEAKKPASAPRGRSRKAAEEVKEASQPAEELKPAAAGRRGGRAKSELSEVEAEDIASEVRTPAKRGRSKKTVEQPETIEEQPAESQPTKPAARGRGKKGVSPAPSATLELPAAMPGRNESDLDEIIEPELEVDPAFASAKKGKAPARGRKARGASVEPAAEPEPEPEIAAPKSAARGKASRAKKAASQEPEPSADEAPSAPRGRSSKAKKEPEVSIEEAPSTSRGRSSRAKRGVSAEPEPSVEPEDIQEEVVEVKTRGRKSAKPAADTEEPKSVLAPRGRSTKKAASVEPEPEMIAEEDVENKKPTRGSKRAAPTKKAAVTEEEGMLSPAAGEVAEGGKVDIFLSDVHVGTHLDVSPSSTEFVSTRYSIQDDHRDHDGDSRSSLLIRHRLGTGLPQVGLQLWGGALLLADYLLAFPEFVREKGVLELGCGTGFVGIVAAKLCGAERVFLTDKGGDGILELAKDNVDGNLASTTATSRRAKRGTSQPQIANTSVLVRQLDWFDDSAALYPVEHDNEEDILLPAGQPSAAPRFQWSDDEVAYFASDCTVLLAADVCYDGFATEMLVNRLKTLLQPTSKKRPRTLYFAIEKRPNFSIQGKETVRAWEELQSALRNANEELVKHGLPGRPAEKRFRLHLEKLDVDEETVPRRFEYQRTERMEIWKVTLRR